MSSPSVVLITGCSEGGIGASLAAEFHAKGCMVYASARRMEAMQSLPAGVHKLLLDVTNEASIKAAVAKVVGEQGRIDILVNNAGMGMAGPLAEVDLQAARQVYEANVWGVLAVTQAVVPHMAERRQGKIINIGSIVGRIATPFGGIYCSSKAAIHSLTDSLRLELKPFNVQVMLVVPGGVRSNIAKNNMQRLDMSRFKVYNQYSAQIEERANASQGPKSTPTEQFARRVVGQALKKKLCRHFWLAHMSRLFRFMSMMPLWLVDRAMAKRFNITKPAQPISVKAD